MLRKSLSCASGVWGCLGWRTRGCWFRFLFFISFLLHSQVGVEASFRTTGSYIPRNMLLLIQILSMNEPCNSFH